MKVIGLMSGTSGDGVDAALVDIRGRGHMLEVRPLEFCPLPYPRSLQQRILAASANGTVTEVCQLNAVLGEWFAKAALRVIKKARLRASDIGLIGSHGQTLHHLPRGSREPGIGMVRSTLQIAEPSVVAERTGITTVANFRPRDLAAGGEGAPLAPYAHYLLLRHPRRSRLIVNLGGISNVTYLPRAASLSSVRAFDTGPGNMVLDALVRRVTGGRMAMDRGGKRAGRGRINDRLLKKLMAHPFLRRPPPKSTGREDFGETFLRELLAMQRRQHLAPDDLLATCAMWTAKSVASCRRWLKGSIDEVVVGGGGTSNRTVMADLSTVFAPAPVITLEELGWQSKSFEAIAFAILGYQTLAGHTSNVPAVTGAHRPVLLGSIVPGSPARLRPKSF
ncbi:MAG: anhydro-N-acetylmuramic acid kinase [Nitrospiraceae bacterium]